MLLVLLACSNDSSLDRVKAPPEATITVPAEGDVLRQGDEDVAIAGTAVDDHDGPSALTATWSMDGYSFDGPVSDDGSVTGSIPGDLALGAHTLDLSVVDADGQEGTAEVSFTVEGPIGAPTVEITAPEDGASFAPGETITFLGDATDETTPADDLSFAWSSDLDGALAGAISGDGQSALVTAALSTGVHVITLTATDTDGDAGAASITVTVEDTTPDPPEPGELIFSEMMIDPELVADEDGEWVELYNTSGSTLDITGYSFHDDAVDYWVFDASVTVAPHDYMVLCANENPAKNGGVNCDGWFWRYPDGEEPTTGIGHGSGVALANNDDELELTSPDGVDVDVFDYDDTDSDPIEAGMAFGLDPSKLDGTANDDMANWCVQTTVLAGASEPGTPGEANDACSASDTGF